MWSRSKPFRSALLLALGLGAAAAPARAEVLDPSMPRVIVVGPPHGLAPSDRLDVRRSGRSQTRLPAAPTEVWRRHVGKLDVSPIIDGAGNVYVATSGIGEIVKIGPDSKELWRVRTG